MLSTMMRRLLSSNPTTIDLFRISRVSWAVRSPHDPEVQHFTSADAAGEYLESLSVPGDEVDFAIMDMTSRNHTRANFGVDKTFLFSDSTRLDEILGSA